jgi:phage baseplate assembly protein W
MPIPHSPTKSFVDISLAWDPSPLTGDITNLYDDRAITNSMKNLVVIAPSEIPFRSDIGSDAYNYLFEIADEGMAGLLNTEIERSITYGEPRVQLISVDTEVVYDSNEYSVNITYKIVGYEEIKIVNFTLSPTR